MPTTRLPVIAFLVSIAAALGLAVVYWAGGQPQWEGVLLCLSLGGIGVGVISWAHRFLPDGPDEEEREPTASSDEQLRALDAELVAAGRSAAAPRPPAGRGGRRLGARGAVPDPFARSKPGPG